MSPTSLLRRFWERMEARDWEAATACLAPELVVRWPHTGEIFDGRDGFMAMNRAYPGDWHIEVLRVRQTAPDEAVSEVAVRDGEQVFHAVSFAAVAGDAIREVTEYWVNPEEAPAWRLEAGWSRRS